MLFAVKTTVFSLLVAAAIPALVVNQQGRAPASDTLPFELHLQSLNISPLTKLQDAKHAHLRVVFNSELTLKLESSELSIAANTSRLLDQKILIDPLWIKDNTLEFRIELVEHGALFDQVVARCAQISKSLDEYNRSYQCTLPGETTPFLTYRLGRQGSVPPKTLAMGL
jgi:hypothetical protein